MTRDERRHLTELVRAADRAEAEADQARKALAAARKDVDLAERTYEAAAAELAREVARLAGAGVGAAPPAETPAWTKDSLYLAEIAASHPGRLVALREEGADGSGTYRFATEAMQAEALAAVGERASCPYPTEWGCYGWGDLCRRLLEAGKAVVVCERGKGSRVYEERPGAGGPDAAPPADLPPLPSAPSGAAELCGRVEVAPDAHGVLLMLECGAIEFRALTSHFGNWDRDDLDPAGYRPTPADVAAACGAASGLRLSGPDHTVGADAAGREQLEVRLDCPAEAHPEPWRLVQLSRLDSLWDGPLHNAGLRRMGELAGYLLSGRRLADIKGVGKKVDSLVQAVRNLWFSATAEGRRGEAPAWLPRAADGAGADAPKKEAKKKPATPRCRDCNAKAAPHAPLRRCDDGHDRCLACLALAVAGPVPAASDAAEPGPTTPPDPAPAVASEPSLFGDLGLPRSAYEGGL